MAQEGLNMAAAEAAGASGGARQQKPPKVWYTMVVYEQPRGKTAVLYLDKAKTFTFKLPAGVNVGSVAVIIKRWRVSDKTVACSTSIHVDNAIKLLDTYAREDAADILAELRRSCGGWPGL